jgi:hypothetical protein
VPEPDPARGACGAAGVRVGPGGAGGGPRGGGGEARGGEEREHGGQARDRVEAAEPGERGGLAGECGEEQPGHRVNVAGPAAGVHVVIPALDEEAALPVVLAALPAGRVTSVVVVDNGSRDGTAAVARRAGARVVSEPRRGYGSACLAGIAALAACPDQDVVVFLDGDGSTDASELGTLIAPILSGEAELVLGSRVHAAGSAARVPAHARAGNALAVWLIARLTGARFTDLGPFRALRLGTLRSLGLADRDFGWNIEMQLRAVRAGVRWREVAVYHHPRAAGTSKISGTVVGSVRAGCKILWTVARHAG